MSTSLLYYWPRYKITYEYCKMEIFALSNASYLVKCFFHSIYYWIMDNEQFIFNIYYMDLILKVLLYNTKHEFQIFDVVHWWKKKSHENRSSVQYNVWWETRILKLFFIVNTYQQQFPWNNVKLYLLMGIFPNFHSSTIQKFCPEIIFLRLKMGEKKKDKERE